MFTVFASATAALHNEAISLSRRGLVTAAAASLAASGGKPEEAAAFVPSRVADLSALHDQPLATAITCAEGDETCASNRRALAREQLQALSAELGNSKSEVDWAGHSSAWGLAPPPIQGYLSYQELLELAADGQIATVQIAVQHDQVVATMRNGHRFASPIKDKDFPWFVADATRADGTVPFEVLPIDPVRQKVREGAFNLMALLGVLYAADELDLLPWDTNVYGSLQEREEAKEQVRRGEGLPSKMKLSGALKALLAKRDAKGGGASDEKESHGAPKLPQLPPLPEMPEMPQLGKLAAWLEEKLLPGKAAGKAAGKEAGEAAGTSSQDEALRRVLGFTKWDAAAELRAKQQKARASESQQKMVERWQHSNDELKAQVLESKAHQKVVAAHDRFLVQPHEQMVTELKADLDEIRAAVRSAPFLTPLTVDHTVSLPTLEQLMSDAHQIGSDGLVAQYIRAHPRLEEVVAARSGEANAALTRLAQTAEAAPAVRGKDASREGFESELDGLYAFCRLCPEFSALYGHRVYICKQPAEAALMREATA